MQKQDNNFCCYLSGAAHFHCCSRVAVVSSRPEEDPGADCVHPAAGDRLQACVVQHPAHDYGLQCMAAPRFEGSHHLCSRPRHPFHVQRPGKGHWSLLGRATSTRPPHPSHARVLTTNLYQIRNSNDACVLFMFFEWMCNLIDKLSLDFIR